MKKVIITGSAGNLGKAVVKKFIDSGYYVIAAISPRENPDELGKNSNMEVHAIDAANETAVSDFLQQLIKKHGSIDAVLMLIGGFSMGTIENSGEEEIKKMFHLNFNTAYFFARPSFRQMIIQPAGGRLVFVGSVPTIDDKAGFDMLPYALSKNAVVKLAKILNAKGQEKNVMSAVIVPTTIDTPQNRTSMPNADFSKWTQPEEIAEVIEFICSGKGKKMKDIIIKM